jgi:hypothetical protein
VSSLHAGQGVSQRDPQNHKRQIQCMLTMLHRHACCQSRLLLSKTINQLPQHLLLPAAFGASYKQHVPFLNKHTSARPALTVSSMRPQQHSPPHQTAALFTSSSSSCNPANTPSSVPLISFCHCDCSPIHKQTNPLT